MLRSFAMLDDLFLNILFSDANVPIDIYYQGVSETFFLYLQIPIFPDR